MLPRLSNVERRGISLTEILIGIMVLGIGVISLATLFPIGLLRMKRAVNDVRGTIVAQSAWTEVRVRNLLAPPFGPPASYFSRYPSPPWNGTNTPTGGLGVPVIIDPMWMYYGRGVLDTAIEGGISEDLNSNGLLDPGEDFVDHFGSYDFVNNATGLPPGDGIPDPGAPVGGEGILRVRGGSPGNLISLGLISEVFSSADDLAYRGGNQSLLPLQEPTGAGPPYLTPTNGVPFSPGSLFRERRYTWLLVAGKVSANQIYQPGPLGDIRENVGPNLIANVPPYPPTNPAEDDPGRDMATGYPVPAPVGPFDVTIVAFYNRDFSSREVVYANNNGPPPSPVFSIVTRTVPGCLTAFPPNVATLRERLDLPFPAIPIGSYIMDTTFDSTTATGPRNGFVYRVTGSSLDTSGVASGGVPVLAVTLDQPARANGLVLTVLKGAVAVFQKEVP